MVQRVNERYTCSQNRMNEMREHVRQLKEEYALALKRHELSPEDALAESSSSSSGKAPRELYTELARVKEQLLEENAALQQLLAEQNALGFKINQLHLEFQSDLVRACVCLVWICTQRSLTSLGVPCDDGVTIRPRASRKISRTRRTTCSRPCPWRSASSSR